MVRCAKRAIKFAVNNQRLSASEFLTVDSEVSNLLNERPIGTLPGADSEFNILTPNNLLLGRATAKNPGDWQPQGNNPRSRYYLVQRLMVLRENGPNCMLLLSDSMSVEHNYSKLTIRIPSHYRR